MKKITKKAYNEAPRFMVSIDYKASYKPMTMVHELVEANDAFEAMKKVDEMFSYDEFEAQVWCLILSEKTAIEENDGFQEITYEQKIRSDYHGRWHFENFGEFYQTYDPEWKVFNVRCRK